MSKDNEPSEFMSKSNNDGVWQTRKEVFITVVGIGLIFTLGLAVANGISALLSGEVAKASDYASFASGLATMVLVGVTGWYTYVTRRLVNESRKSRIQEQKRTERRQEEEIKSLRKSFLHEIKSLEGLDNAEDFGESITIYRNVAPIQVYVNNADKLGKLTEKETEHIIEYYGHINYLKDLFFAVREGEYGWEESEEAIRETIEIIQESQRKSIEAIKENLEDGEVE